MDILSYNNTVDGELRRKRFIMYWIIERIEWPDVICEDEAGRQSVFSMEDFPEGAQEGDVVSQSDSGWKTEPELTEQRRRRLREKFEKLLR